MIHTDRFWVELFGAGLSMIAMVVFLRRSHRYLND